MTKTTTTSPQTPGPEAADPEVLAFRAQFDHRIPLDEIVRQGAQQMLQAAIDAEVDQFLIEHAAKTDEHGRRYVVRNGHLPSRTVATGAGELEIQQPRVRDNDPDKSKRARFTPSIIPQYIEEPFLGGTDPCAVLVGHFYG